MLRDTYQVITAKKAGVVITNKTDPTRDILPGDTVTVQLTGVYHPANTMANLYNLYAYVSYTDPGSDDTVTGYKNFSQRHLFDRADGDSCRTVEVNRYFKENGDGWEEIRIEEYEERAAVSACR